MNTRPWFLKLTAAALSIVLATTAAVAADKNSPVMQRVLKSSTLRVGMTGAQAPFNMTNRDGKIIGMDRDMAEYMAKSIGVELEIVPLKFVDLLPALEEGEVDIVISGMTSTLERNTRVAFVGPYMMSGTSILTTEATLEKMDTQEKLSAGNHRIAALKGSTSESFAEAALKNPQMTATDTHAEAVQLLLDGKVDAVVADAPTCALSILRNPDAGLVSLNRPLTFEPIGIAVAPGDALFLNFVQNYLQALAASGGLESLQGKWFKNGNWLAQMP